MTPLSLRELELSEGTIIRCVSEDTDMFSHDVDYVVEQAEDGKLGVVTDCGFHATSSSSLFIIVYQVLDMPLEAPVSDSQETSSITTMVVPDYLPMLPELHTERPTSITYGELRVIGSGENLGRSCLAA